MTFRDKQLKRVQVAERRLEGAGSEARLARIQRQFRRVTGVRPMSRADRTQLGIGLWLIAWATCVGVVGVILVSQMREEWGLAGNLQHLGAYPNCSFARVMGVAPADVGQPGYWPSHDRDMDGIACEPVPAWVER